MTQKVVFFGSSQGVFSNRHFNELIEAPCKIVAVVNTPSSKHISTNTDKSNCPSFAEVAKELNIPVFQSHNPNSKDFIKAMEDLSPDLFIAVGYMFLLKEEILSVPNFMAVNFHASLLPAYRGKHPVFWALRNDEQYVGLTVHVMNSHLDKGDILYQIRIRTRKDDSVSALYSRIIDESKNLIGELIKDTKKGWIYGVAQSDVEASCYSSVSEDDYKLDWSWDADKLSHWINTSPGQCYYNITNRKSLSTRTKKVFFTEARVIKKMHNKYPGTLLRVDKRGCTVAAGRNAIRIYKVRIENRKDKKGQQFCFEIGLKVGDLLK